VCGVMHDCRHDMQWVGSCQEKMPVAPVHHAETGAWCRNAIIAGSKGWQHAARKQHRSCGPNGDTQLYALHSCQRLNVVTAATASEAKISYAFPKLESLALFSPLHS
jgi:hypothetical protein